MGNSPADVLIGTFSSIARTGAFGDQGEWDARAGTVRRIGGLLHARATLLAGWQCAAHEEIVAEIERFSCTCLGIRTTTHATVEQLALNGQRILGRFGNAEVDVALVPETDPVIADAPVAVAVVVEAELGEAVACATQPLAFADEGGDVARHLILVTLPAPKRQGRCKRQ